MPDDPSTEPVPPVAPRPPEPEELGGDPACWAELVEDHRDEPDGPTAPPAERR